MTGLAVSRRVTLRGWERYTSRNGADRRLLVRMTRAMIWDHDPLLVVLSGPDSYAGALTWIGGPLPVLTGLHVDARCRGAAMGRLLWRRWIELLGVDRAFAVRVRSVAGLRFAVRNDCTVFGEYANGDLSAEGRTSRDPVRASSVHPGALAWSPARVAAVRALPDDR